MKMIEVLAKEGSCGCTGKQKGCQMSWGRKKERVMYLGLQGRWQDDVGVNCLRDPTRNVAIGSDTIKNTWKSYMDKLLNVENACRERFKQWEGRRT